MDCKLICLLMHNFQNVFWRDMLVRYGQRRVGRLASGPVAQWITRLTTDQKIPGSNPGRFDCFFLLAVYVSDCDLWNGHLIWLLNEWEFVSVKKTKKVLENPGIDPGTSHMLSERSTIWANPPTAKAGSRCSSGPRLELKSSIEMHSNCPELNFDGFRSNYFVLNVIWKFLAGSDVLSRKCFISGETVL